VAGAIPESALELFIPDFRASRSVEVRDEASCFCAAKIP
jgi:hypothetical protein